MKQNRINEAQWRELIANYISYCNSRGNLGLLVKTDNLRHISNAIWDEWSRIISTNCNRLSQSADFNELYEQIEDLKIRGIGAQSMIVFYSANNPLIIFLEDNIVIQIVL